MTDDGHKRLLDNGEPAPFPRERWYGGQSPEVDALSMETSQLPREAIEREAEAVMQNPPRLPSYANPTDDVQELGEEGVGLEIGGVHCDSPRTPIATGKVVFFTQELEQKRRQQLASDQAWIQAHWAELQEKYDGLWIAVFAQEVLGVGDDVVTSVEELHRRDLTATPICLYVRRRGCIEVW